MRCIEKKKRYFVFQPKDKSALVTKKIPQNGLIGEEASMADEFQ